MATDDEFPAQPATGRTGEEMGHMPREPLLPVEKQLIAGSLILGAALLGLLVWLSYAFFPPPALTARSSAPAASAPR